MRCAPSKSSARHLSFTLAADELQRHADRGQPAGEEPRGPARRGAVPPAAARARAHRRGPGTAAGAGGSFGRIGAVLEQFDGGRCREVLTVGGGGHLRGRLADAAARRLPAAPSVRRPAAADATTTASTSPARGSTSRSASATAPGTAPRPSTLIDAPLSPLCAPAIARRLHDAADLAHETLLRSYRVDEWAALVRGRRHRSCRGIARAGVRFLADDGRGGDAGRGRGAAAGRDVRARAARRTGSCSPSSSR